MGLRGGRGPSQAITKWQFASLSQIAHIRVLTTGMFAAAGEHATRIDRLGPETA